ncbi:MAG: hypothetical protein RL136_1636 [Planctomycetota bacterium]|jgi:hypothetical protein
MEGTATTNGNGWLDELFAGRRVVVAQLPPAPVRATRPNIAILGRVLVLLFLFAVALLAGVGIGSASGRWWVGLLVFLLFGWVLLLLAIGLVGAVKVERAARVRRAEKAREDPIGRLLPNRSSGRKAFLDPASYRGLLALENRPVLVLDAALFDQKSPGAIRALAAAGRMPEPETLDVSRVPAGIWVVGLFVMMQSMRLWVPILEAATTGAPLVWWNWLGAIPLVLGPYLFFRDPYIRRKLGLSGFFGRDAVIGAGWLLDERGRTWTVDDTVVLVTTTGSGVEVRLLHAERVHAFYLPVMLVNRAGKGAARPKPRRLRGRAKELMAEAVAGSAEAIGLERGPAPDEEMPGPDEPLRLLLSSWTYPEPRPDLAMRE